MSGQQRQFCWQTRKIIYKDRDGDEGTKSWISKETKVPGKYYHRLPANDGEIQRTEMVPNINQKPNCTGKL